ncbi:transient receptor potential cation channel subfamily M member-like 2 isoform X2 [Gigantopelta aegis]|uniref:transient receptor potential cation channel subfamily M member-like 2 isoform X2 n=1 Tax=Gigantopelta aegis TaxID=1735272 RepID=UPI001B88A3DD|nr:transient receptor potential cation channel subfamily M member-like 2 isoform X2 [Gigantopelta aegis]
MSSESGKTSALSSPSSPSRVISLSSGKLAEIIPVVVNDDCGQGDQPSPSADKNVTSHNTGNMDWDFGGGEPSESMVDDLTTDQSTKTNDDVGYATCTDPAYATVTSVGSYISRESSTDVLLPNLPGGIIEFIQEGAERNQTDGYRYYVIIPKDTPVDDIANYMAYGWKRRTPKIVLSVISSVKYFKQWEDEKHIEDFQAGIIKAANLTEMWIVTNGFDSGVAKYIGDAACDEMARRKSQEEESLEVKNIQVLEKVPKLTILGVVAFDSISYSDHLDGQHVQPKQIENRGHKPRSSKFDLNPFHTHFMMVKDINSQELNAFRYSLEVRFLQPVGRARRYRRMPSSHTTLPGTNSDLDLNMGESQNNPNTNTPVISLLVQGGPPEIDQVLWLLKKKIPVIVMKGFGLAADLIAFAYEETRESYIKSELMKRVKDTFPKEFKKDDLAVIECRDKILECAFYAHQDSLTYLTILDTGNRASDLTNLSKYILMALFKSQTRKLGHKWRDQIQRDLQLTLDWNRCDLAKSEIYQKYSLTRIRVENHIFHQALLREDREDFVELFLDKGFQVHRYLSHKRLHNLFENARDKEFFIGVCLEGVLGKAVNPHSPLSRNFCEDDGCELNRLLSRCTKLQKLINPYELSMNSLGTYITNKAVAERRATTTLVLWAALTNRPILAKVFWKKTDDPIAVALIVSMLLHRLASQWCKDVDMKRRVKATAVEFGKMAVSMLDLCYQDSSIQAFHALNKKLQDFNNRTVVEIAKMGNNKFFIAHPCCQKWLAQRWLGCLQIRELDWGGHIKLPDWLKVYLSAFLIFPMFVWIAFVPMENVKQKFEKEDDEEEEEVEETNMLLRPLSIQEKQGKKRYSMKVKFKNLIDRGEVTLKLPVYKQIYYLWSAPITKFWVNQLFYVFFLILFSLAVLWPSCGDLHLNLSVFVWTFIIWIELARRTWVKKWKHPEVPIFWTSIEVILILCFLLLYLVFRIIPHFVEYVDYMTTKFVMSIGLLFFYYRTMAVFLPISPTLGPMLIRITKMVRKDFSTWMRMFVIVMVSGGITIHAVLYPSYPLNVDGVKKALARAFFAMFLTKIDDLDGDDTCSYLYENTTIGSCHPEQSVSYRYGNTMSTCPYGSFGGYFIVIQYLLITKLVLITLLYAMFSVTNARISDHALEYWKYQRYGLIVDFEERLRLPPPLTIISYICMLLKFIWTKVIRPCWTRCRQCCRCFTSQDSVDASRHINIFKSCRTMDYNYWKNCVKVYINKEKQDQLKETEDQRQSETLCVLVDDMQSQKETNRRLNDRLGQIEKSLTSCRLLLEEMKHMMEAKDMGTKGLIPPKKLIHISSRQSPYPGTRIQRFPIFDKYVPWEVTYDTYDPAWYTRPVEEFPPEIIGYVDIDIMQLRQQEEERKKLGADELEDLPPLPVFEPMWNSVFSSYIKDTDVQIEVDRTSWITFDNQPLRYRLDKSGLPQVERPW